MHRRELLASIGLIAAGGAARAIAQTPQRAQAATSATQTPPSELDARIAEAFTYAFGPHDLARARWRATADPSGPRRATPNALQHVRRLLDHRARTVTTPNNDTLYTSGWLDLSGGPATLSVPAMGERYWSLAFMDPFTDHAALVSRRTSGGTARRLWIAPPGWTGAPPPDATPLPMPSFDVWLLGRVLVDGEADLPAVHALQDALRLDAPAAARPWSTAPDETDARAFVAFANEALGRNPSPARDAAVLARIAAAGIVPGETRAWERLDEASRAAWTRLLPGMRRALARGQPRFATAVGPGWTSGPDAIGRFGDDHALRAHVALVGLAALPREEAIYARSDTDSAGAPLDGGRACEIRVPPGLPVDGFWSISMYRVEPDGRLFFVENPIGRFSIGDRTPGLAREPDGSLRLRIRRDAPPDAAGRANWLPAPEGRFSLSWRLYEPGEALVARRATLPGIEPVAG